MKEGSGIIKELRRRIPCEEPPMRFVQCLRSSCLILGLAGVGTMLSSAPAVARDWGRLSAHPGWGHHHHRVVSGGYGSAYWPRNSFRVGLVIPVLSTASTTVLVGGVPYHYAQGVYYGAVTGGYAIVPTPPIPPIVEVQASTTPPNAPTGSAAPSDGSGSSAAPLLPPSDWILYPRSGQSAVQTQADRQECNQWASAQNQANLASVYQRALWACLDAKGYTVR